MNKQILIIGDATHGKTELAKIWNRRFGMQFKDSSLAASEIFLFDKLKDKYGYETPEDCHKDRVNHRDEWYDLICEYNKHEPARLAKEILKDNDCYVGMRSDVEIKRCDEIRLFDLKVWVDASGRKDPEPKSSTSIDKSFADIVINNNTTLADFVARAIRLGAMIFPDRRF